MAQGEVNLGLLGADWGPNGGGLTVLALRAGGSKDRGLELGLNPGIGIQVDGRGIYTGARADIGIRDGVSVSAGARIVALDSDIIAAAEAHAHVSDVGSRAAVGSSHAVAAAKHALRFAEERKAQCAADVDVAQKALLVAQENVEHKMAEITVTKTEIANLEAKRNKVGQEKTMAGDILLQVSEDLNDTTSSLSDCERKRQLMIKYQRASQAVVLATEITTLSTMISALEMRVEQYQAVCTDLSTRLLALHENLVEQEKALQNLAKEQDIAQSVLAQKQRELQVASEQLQNISQQVTNAAEISDRENSKYSQVRHAA